MAVRFPFEIKSSGVFGPIRRPVAKVDFWSRLTKNWVEIILLVDTGADYTLLPKFYAEDLGVDVERECAPHITSGVGGGERVYLLPRMHVRIDGWELAVPVGFLERDNIPALLGRQYFLEDFKVEFHRHITAFSHYRRTRRRTLA